MARTRIEDLPTAENLTQQELEEIFGAGLRCSSRPPRPWKPVRSMPRHPAALIADAVPPPATGSPGPPWSGSSCRRDRWTSAKATAPSPGPRPGST